MNISQFNVDKLDRSQMRVVIDRLGFPFRNQPSKISEARKIASELYSSNPEKFEKAYNWVKGVEEAEKESPNEEMSTLALKIVKEAETVERSTSARAYEESLLSMVERFQESLSDSKEEWEQTTKEAIKAAKAEFITIKISSPGKKSKKVTGIVHEKFERMIQLANRRKNVMLVGPSGCGKTHVAAQIADALGLDYASQSCSAGVSESVFTGWLLPIKEGGTFQYVASKFIDMYENGGVFLFDEMDNGDENVLAFLNQALAQDHFFLPQRFENPLIKKHADFVAIGAMNTMGTGADAMYTARNALDAATLDRFRLGFIHMDYSEQVESQLVDDEILAWGLAIRKVIAEKGLPKIMSTRVLIDASEMKEFESWDVDMIEEGYFADWGKEEIAIVRSALV